MVDIIWRITREPYPWRKNGYTLSPSPSPGLLLTAGFLWLEPISVGVRRPKEKSLASATQGISSSN